MSALINLFFWRRAVKKAETEFFQTTRWERGSISDAEFIKTTKYGKRFVAMRNETEHQPTQPNPRLSFDRTAAAPPSAYPATQRVIDHTTRGFRDRPYC